MNTEKQTTEIKPTTVTSHLTGEQIPRQDIHDLIDRQDAERAARIAADPDAFLPPLSELRITDDNIRDQQLHWDSTFTAVSALVERWEAGQKEAEEVINEIKAITGRPRTTAEKNLLAAAIERLSRFAWRLKRDSNRLFTARLNQKTWKERRRAFDANDRPRMIRLQQQENKKNRILKTVTG